MKHLLALAILAAAGAVSAAPGTPTPTPQAEAAAPAASAVPVRGCVREEVTTRMVNGKEVQVRHRVRDRNPDCPKPAAVKLWD